MEKGFLEDALPGPGASVSLSRGVCHGDERLPPAPPQPSPGSCRPPRSATPRSQPAVSAARLPAAPASPGWRESPQRTEGGRHTTLLARRLPPPLPPRRFAAALPPSRCPSAGAPGTSRLCRAAPLPGPRRAPPRWPPRLRARPPPPALPPRSAGAASAPAPAPFPPGLREMPRLGVGGAGGSGERVAPRFVEKLCAYRVKGGVGGCEGEGGGEKPPPKTAYMNFQALDLPPRSAQ